MLLYYIIGRLISKGEFMEFMKNLVFGLRLRNKSKRITVMCQENPNKPNPPLSLVISTLYYVIKDELPEAMMTDLVSIDLDNAHQPVYSDINRDRRTFGLTFRNNPNKKEFITLTQNVGKPKCELFNTFNALAHAINDTWPDYRMNDLLAIDVAY